MLQEKEIYMDKIKTGLAAFGMSGQVFHAPFISTNPHFELTAITERSKELSKVKYPQSRIVRSFEELIGMEECLPESPLGLRLPDRERNIGQRPVRPSGRI